MNEAARKGWNTFERREFLEALPDIRVKVFTSRTIRSSFRCCGLWPFKPSVVLDPLRAKFKSPSPEMEVWYGEGGGSHGTPPRLPSSSSSSPKTLQNLHCSINKTKAVLDEFGNALDSISPKLNQKIQQIFSGSLHQAESNAMHQRENGRLLQSIEQQNKPQSCRLVKGPTSLSSTGILTVKDAKQSIKKHADEEGRQGQGRKRKRSSNDQENNPPTPAENQEILGSGEILEAILGGF